MTELLEIAFDMDGVLARFFSSKKNPKTGLFDRFNAKYGTSFTEEMMVKPDVHSVFPEDVADKMYDVFNAPNFYTELEPHEGAQETVNTILDAGHECDILTSPSNHPAKTETGEPITDHAGEEVRVINGESAKGKIQWIEKNLIRLGKHITITKKKYRFQCDRLVEDTPSQLDKWCPRHPDGIGLLIDQPWNQDWPNQPKNAIRISHIREVLNYI